MTVDELAQRTIYARQEWQSVRDVADFVELPEDQWVALAGHIVRSGLTPAMALKMIEITQLPTTEIDWNALANYGRVSMRGRNPTIYFDFRDWWVGYYRGDTHHYVCLLPTLVLRWDR